MKHLLILAFAISPTKGSEFSVAWNYVVKMSRYNRLTVFYGVSGEYLGDCDEMEEFIKTKGVPNVRFVCIKPSKWTSALNWCNRHNFFNYTFYFAYHAWQKHVYKEAKRLVQKEKFDLIHFIGPTGFREAGYLWKLGLPYIWGPIGGANSNNLILTKNISLISRLKFLFRNWANRFQLKYQMQLRKALKNTDLLLTSTSENQYIFQTVLHINSEYLPENSIAPEIKMNTLKVKNTEKYHFIFVCSLIPRKAVNIILEALVLVKHKDKIIVDIVGDGSERKVLESFAERCCLQPYINWYGQLPRDKAVDLFNKAHMHIITSTSEGNPTTIWEAMSYGVPTMSFDHCGMHDTICKRCGILIPIHSYDQCVADLAIEIDKLLEQPERFKQLAEGTVKCAQNFTWKVREKFLIDCYSKVLKKYDIEEIN